MYTHDLAGLHIAAWSYEKHGVSLMADSEYDALVLRFADDLPEDAIYTGIWVYAAATPSLQYVVTRILEIRGRAPGWCWRHWGYRMLNILERGLEVRDSLEKSYSTESS